jgi:hypothetical protein
VNCAHWALPIALVAGICLPGLAAADDPPGMVLNLSGTTVPALREHEEIPADTAVQLGSGTLTFVHYQKCKRVTVTGGIVTLSESDYGVSGGTIDSEKNFPCPPRRLNISGDTAAVLSRGVSPRFPANPEFIFTGPHAEAITAAEIYPETQNQIGQPVSRLVLAEDHASMPPGAAPLKPNRRYLLMITTSLQPEPIEVKFIGGPATEGADPIVLRVD